MSYADRSK